MTVSELIQILEDCDQDAQVLIAHQPEWPFEYSVHGVTVRGEAGEDSDDGEAVDSDEAGPISPTDVFICDGRQLRYASKRLWQ